MIISQADAAQFKIPVVDVYNSVWWRFQDGEHHLRITPGYVRVSTMFTRRTMAIEKSPMR